MIELSSRTERIDTMAIARAATECLESEVALYPKPGLVSPVDSGAHDDMDAALMYRSARALQPFFERLARAGAGGAGLNVLRAIGVEAESAMLAATRGVNTHRGAIFGMGLLCAAAGLRMRQDAPVPLGRIVAQRWGAELAAGPIALNSHGSTVSRQHGAGGARAEAAAGFPSLYAIALPALAEGRRRRANDPRAAQVHALMTLVAHVADTNLLYRGGVEGLDFAQAQAQAFLDAGGCAAPEWRARAIGMHHAFVARGLSPGGCADLLGMALFVESQDVESQEA